MRARRARGEERGWKRSIAARTTHFGPLPSGGGGGSSFGRGGLGRSCPCVGSSSSLLCSFGGCNGRFGNAVWKVGQKDTSQSPKFGKPFLPFSTPSARPLSHTASPSTHQLQLTSSQLPSRKQLRPPRLPPSVKQDPRRAPSNWGA